MFQQQKRLLQLIGDKRMEALYSTSTWQKWLSGRKYLIFLLIGLVTVIECYKVPAD